MSQLIKKRIVERVNKLTKDGRIYIFLTVSGGYFCSLIFILFLISLSYANSLAYLCSFLFLSVVWISCVVTNFNLHGLEFIRLRTEEVYFETEPVIVELDFKNTGTKPRFDIEGSLNDAESEFISEIDAGESKSLRLELKNKKVGIYQLKKLDLCTSFPFGLFRSWKPYKIEKEIFIVPHPKFKALPLEQVEETGERGMKTDQQNDEFKTHKKYSTEEVGRIDWKIYARRGELLLKEFEGEVSQSYEFKDQQLGALPLKEKLSHLTYWLIEAEKRGAYYALEIEGEVIGSGTGGNHLNKCLRLVALMGGKA